MLTVAMITDLSAFDDKVDGGVQAVTKYLVDALRNLEGVDLHVVSFDNKATDTRTVRQNGFSRYVLPASRLGTLTGFRRDQRALDNCLAEIAPDVVHGQGAGRDGLLARRSRYPSVITIHGILGEEARFFSSVKRRIQHRVLSWLSRRHCIRGARHTILISPYVAEYYGDELAGEKHFIPNPISDEFFSIRRDPVPGRILFAGRLLPLKGVLELVRAAGRLSASHSIELILAGSLDHETYVEKLREEAKSLGLEPVVRFKGILNEQEIRDELSRCSVLVLPSYQETAPMVIAEAMAAGVPVIASDVGGVRHQVGDGRTGYLVEPGDVPGLAEKLDEVLSNPGMLESFGKKAREEARSQYASRRVAEQTLAVYESVVSDNAAR